MLHLNNYVINTLIKFNDEWVPILVEKEPVILSSII